MHFLSFLFFAQVAFQGITLDEFGTLPNQNQTLQPDARFNPDQPLRTNDYQPLQQVIATDRQIVRMGAFYISQGAEGPGITLPSSQTNTSEEITTPIDEVRLIFGSPDTTFNRTTDLLTTQAMTVTYYIPGAAVPTTDDTDATIVDYNIIGNAYHDVRYNNLIPEITFEGSTIASLEVDGRAITPGAFIPPSRKWKITLANGQTFLLYFEQSDDTIFLLLSSDFTTLTTILPITGFFRIAAIVPSPPTASTSSLATLTPSESWSTAIVQQTRPASPLAMFMLWPVEWTQSVGPEIRRLILQRFAVPSCPLVAQLLPVLARSDFATANTLFNQLRAINNFGDDTNAFLTYFNMVIARDLSGPISTYQAAAPLPIANVFTSAAIESAFDERRAIIPISADVEFTENSHNWTYTTIGGDNPLILFPSYKTLQTLPPLPSFGYADAIKGPLYGSPAFDNEIFFLEQAVPDWYADDTVSDPFDLIKYFPNFLQLSAGDLGRLNLLFNLLGQQLISTDEITGVDTTNLVTTVGQQVFTLALTAKTALFTLSRSGGSRNRIRALTESLINEVKGELTAWLATHTRRGLPIADYFAADNVTGGICTSLGMGASSEQTSSVDEGNAIYNNHHLQYGYWLAAAAFVVEWDEIFQTSSPWISLSASSSATNKNLVDMLWRDARNFLTDDELPFNRHGNPWEGHSTQNGIRYTVVTNGRLQERFGEDFFCWMATQLYARAIQQSSTVSDANKVGFSELATFAQTNLQMTANSGKLIFQDLSWLYSGPYAVNLTVGTVTDSTTEAQTTLQAGTPCAISP